MLEGCNGDRAELTEAIKWAVRQREQPWQRHRGKKQNSLLCKLLVSKRKREEPKKGQTALNAEPGS